MQTLKPEMHKSDKGDIQNVFHGLLRLGATAQKEAHWSSVNFHGGQDNKMNKKVHKNGVHESYCYIKRIKFFL